MARRERRQRGLNESLSVCVFWPLPFAERLFRLMNVVQREREKVTDRQTDRQCKWTNSLSLRLADSLDDEDRSVRSIEHSWLAMTRDLLLLLCSVTLVHGSAHFSSRDLSSPRRLLLLFTSISIRYSSTKLDQSL